MIIIVLKKMYEQKKCEFYLVGSCEKVNLENR